MCFIRFSIPSLPRVLNYEYIIHFVKLFFFICWDDNIYCFISLLIILTYWLYFKCWAILTLLWSISPGSIICCLVWFGNIFLKVLPLRLQVILVLCSLFLYCVSLFLASIDWWPHKIKWDVFPHPLWKSSFIFEFCIFLPLVLLNS